MSTNVQKKNLQIFAIVCVPVLYNLKNLLWLMTASHKNRSYHFHFHVHTKWNAHTRKWLNIRPMYHPFYLTIMAAVALFVNVILSLFPFRVKTQKTTTKTHFSLVATINMQLALFLSLSLVSFVFFCLPFQHKIINISMQFKILVKLSRERNISYGRNEIFNGKIKNDKSDDKFSKCKK